MAGLRCGYCVTQRANISSMRSHQVWDSVNIMALVAALASLKDPDHVNRGRALNTEVKKTVSAELDTLGYRYIPSHANFMMIDLRREVRPVIDAMRSRNVEVWASLPCPAELHARHDRNRPADGAVSVSVQGSNGVTRLEDGKAVDRRVGNK